MSYIDGFVIAVPNANREKFIAHASTFDAIFVEYGATRVVECWGDDVPDGKLTDFSRAVQAKRSRVFLGDRQRPVAPAQRVGGGVRRRVGEDRQDERLGVPERVTVVPRAG